MLKSAGGSGMLSKKQTGQAYISDHLGAFVHDELLWTAFVRNLPLRFQVVCPNDKPIGNSELARDSVEPNGHLGDEDLRAVGFADAHSSREAKTR
jgi:hypothetical protein